MIKLQFKLPQALISRGFTRRTVFHAPAFQQKGINRLMDIYQIWKHFDGFAKVSAPKVYEMCGLGIYKPCRPSQILQSEELVQNVIRISMEEYISIWCWKIQRKPHKLEFRGTT